MRVHNTHNTVKSDCITHNPGTTAQQNKLFVFSLQSPLTTLATEIQKASVSQWSSIYSDLCPHLKRHVHTIHIATWKEIAAEKIRSTYICDSGAASRPWAMGASLSRLPALLLLPEVEWLIEWSGGSAQLVTVHHCSPFTVCVHVSFSDIYPRPLSRM